MKKIRPEPESLPLSSGCQPDGIFWVVGMYNVDASVMLMIHAGEKKMDGERVG